MLTVNMVGGAAYARSGGGNFFLRESEKPPVRDEGFYFKPTAVQA